MYVRGYLQGSENGRVVTIDALRYVIHSFSLHQSTQSHRKIINEGKHVIVMTLLIKTLKESKNS